MERKVRFLRSQSLLTIFLAAGTVCTGTQAVAQEPNPMAQKPGQANPGQANSGAVTKQDGTYLYRVNVVQRDLDAVNYLHRSGPTSIRFEGTPLLPGARGEAKVESGRGGITINAKFEGLTPANGFGHEYLTYVLWAISPDGRPNNLGEILPAGKKTDITVTTALQSFGLIVTAEPYFSVSMPSDLVVVQNVIQNNKTEGVLEKVNAHYALLPRGAYAETAGAKTVARPITRDEKAPLELYQAYNAMRIAQEAGAEKYAPDIWNEASQDLQNAAGIQGHKKGDRKMEITFARQAVQRAEDARLVTLRKQAADRQLEAELAKRDAQAQAQQSQLDAARAQAAKAQADADRARAEAAAAAANSQAAAATKNAEDANAVREKLRTQLNSVLATSETARGLIVNMSDVLFDTGQHTLKPDTKISLAKVSGILQAYPGLKLQVEGYTDSVGGADFNQKLSESRALAVRDFLVAQGVQMNNIDATGYGQRNPVADNGTSAGRAQNRRVQLVVSGDAIGVHESAAEASSR